MKKQKNILSGSAIIRQQAEKVVVRKEVENGSKLFETDTLRLVHELQVNQIELEMQNEELKRAKEEAEVASQKYTELYDFAPTGYFTVTKEGRIVELNLRGANVLGKPKSDLTNSIFTSFVSNDTKSVFNLFLKKIFSTKTKQTCEVILFAGDSLPINVYLKGIVSKNGEQCTINTFDISERKRHEEDLRKSEQRYRSLFEQSNDAILLLDLESGSFIDCNKQAETLTGYTREEIISMKTYAFLPPQQKQEAIANIELAVSSKELRKVTEIITKNGKLIPIEFNYSEVEINNRQCALSILHDISEQKAAEEALKQSEERVRLKLQSILSPEGSISDLELQDIIDVPSVQNLLDDFYELVQIPVAILDNNGKVLVGAGWQEICTKFHRVNPKLCKNCYESDVNLTKGIADGEFRMYKCKNNMWDIATPLVIGGEHKGNLFMGQFFFENEPVDINLFRKQASNCKFDESEYLDALKKLPRVSREKVELTKSFFLKLARSISQLSYSNIKLSRAIAQQKSIEEKLREKELLLNKAQEIAHLGSWSLDFSSYILTWSEEMYRIFDVLPHEFPANFEEFLVLVHPDDREKVNVAYNSSIMEGKDSYEVEHRIICKHSGELRHILEKCEHVKDASGKIIRSVGMSQDITKQKQSEETVRENERLLRESQTAAQIGSYSADLIQKTWKATPAIYEIFGIDKTYPHTLDGWSQCIHPVFRTELTRDLFQNENTSNIFEHEYKIIRVSDGAERWVYGRGKFEYDNQMNPIRLIGTIQDITKRKQAEEALKQLNEELDNRVNERTEELLNSNIALKQADEKYRTVADHAYDWEYWINEDGKIQYMSPSVKRITGYSTQEFMANPQLIAQIVFSNDRELWESHVAEAHTTVREDKINEIIFRINSKIGDIRWIEHSCKGIFKDGKYMGLRVSNRDITERVKAENELLNITFEVEERERNRFSLELHDDLGPLLSSVKLYFQWLAETDISEKKKIITEKGNISIEKAIQTTREIAHGLGSQMVKDVGFIEAVQNFIQNINETQKLHIDFKFLSVQKLSSFLEITLYRIITELINNTLKYAFATRVEIDFDFNRENNIILVTYKDDGIGFDLLEMEKANNGLGLINIKRRINLLNGIYKIDSGIGKGMFVYIELPIDAEINSNQTENHIFQAD